MYSSPQAQLWQPGSRFSLTKAESPGHLRMKNYPKRYVCTSSLDFMQPRVLSISPSISGGFAKCTTIWPVRFSCEPGHFYLYVTGATEVNRLSLSLIFRTERRTHGESNPYIAAIDFGASPNKRRRGEYFVGVPRPPSILARARSSCCIGDDIGIAFAAGLVEDTSSRSYRMKVRSPLFTS